MEILRVIGRHEILVETSEPVGISFEETLVPERTGGVLELSKREVLRALSNGDEYIPLTTEWELLDRCNLRCPFCYIVGHSTNRIVRFADIRDHLDDLVDQGLLFCTLTGGEVTIHPDFQQIYRFLRERGVVVDVFSNGIALSPEVIALFVELPPASIEVSLYSLDDARMGKVFGSHLQNCSETVTHNILSLKRSGLNVVCKTFVNTTTVDEVPIIADWCKGHGIEYYTSNEITAAYDGADLKDFHVRSATTQLAKGASVPAVCFPCGAKNYGSAIDSAFRISPCSSIRLPESTFDLRSLGVAGALSNMRDFIHRFRDEKIVRSCGSSGGCASCIAFAKPVRSASGAILAFAHP